MGHNRQKIALAPKFSLVEYSNCRLLLMVFVADPACRVTSAGVCIRVALKKNIQYVLAKARDL
jgi:hypothetical protein